MVEEVLRFVETWDQVHLAGIERLGTLWGFDHELIGEVEDEIQQQLQQHSSKGLK
jgi:hypothetical protein